MSNDKLSIACAIDDSNNVTKKGAFPNENALLKLIYLRITELQNKWKGGSINNWAMVMNQLLVNDNFKNRIIKYIDL